jgi:hypothetical protein
MGNTQRAQNVANLILGNVRCLFNPISLGKYFINSIGTFRCWVLPEPIGTGLRSVKRIRTPPMLRLPDFRKRPTETARFARPVLLAKTNGESPARLPASLIFYLR